MTNPLTGKKAVEVEGRIWTLGLDFNAMCSFEEKTGKNAFGVISAFEQGKISALDIRALMWAMLVGDQPDVTLEQAGEILTKAPEALKEAIQGATPDPSKQKSGKAPALAKG